LLLVTQVDGDGDGDGEVKLMIGKCFRGLGRRARVWMGGEVVMMVKAILKIIFGRAVGYGFKFRDSRRSATRQKKLQAHTLYNGEDT